MKTEADFEEGGVVIYCNKDETRKFTGVADYSYGDEKEGYIRVQQVFSESSDIPNTIYVPVTQIYESPGED